MYLVNALLRNIKPMFHFYTPGGYRSYFFISLPLNVLNVLYIFPAREFLTLVLKLSINTEYKKSDVNQFYRDMLSFTATKMQI